MEPAGDARAYYGHLFEGNKRPTQLLDALLRGIARHIIESVGDTDVRVLSPTKLSAFYKAVGGNYDTLFVDIPHPSISYIYQAIGCQHTLEPTGNDFAAPSIPALTLRGFVRWESIETLLDPHEHVPFLQAAVRNFEIKHPETGERFPIDLPADAFPSRPDPFVERWHSACAEKLRQQATPDELEPEHTRPNPPPRRDIRAGYAHVRHPASPGRAPREREQGADYFSSRPVRYSHVAGGESTRSGASRRASYRPSLQPTAGSPSSPHLRRRSFPDNVYSPEGTPAPASAQPTPLDTRSRSHDNARRYSHPRHRREPSTPSSSNSDSESSSSESEPRSPTAMPRRKSHISPKIPASTIRVSAPPSASSTNPSSPQRSNHSLPVPRPRERLAPYKIPVDAAGNVSPSFMRHVPAPHGPDFSSGSGNNSSGSNRRRASVNVVPPRSGSHEGRYAGRSMDRERERERERERDRDRFSDRDEKEMERRREPRNRNPSPATKGLDWRKYIPEILR